MERDRIAMRVYVGECGGSRSMVRPQKRWIDTGKGCFRKRGLYSGREREWCRIGVNGWGLWGGMHGAYPGG